MKHFLLFISSVALILVLVSGLAAEPREARSCLALTRTLASSFNLTIDPPNAAAKSDGAAPRTNRLARSDDLLEPPPTNDSLVVEPPEENGSEMPTLPGADDDAGPSDLSKSEVLESLLIAARNDALNGRQEMCFEKLEKAKKLIFPKRAMMLPPTRTGTRTQLSPPRAANHGTAS